MFQTSKEFNVEKSVVEMFSNRQMSILYQVQISTSLMTKYMTGFDLGSIGSRVWP